MKVKKFDLSEKEQRFTMKPLGISSEFRTEIEKRFWDKVNKRKDGHWIWTGAHNNTGYGVFSVGGKMFVAHRVVAWLRGIVDSLSAPAGSTDKTHVLHTCDIRDCCNPRHLFLGSYSDNQLDAYAKGKRKQSRIRFAPATLRKLRENQKT